jgi:predicted nucleic acid-binding protein
VLIVDANVLVAVMNRRDTHHVRMTALLEARDDEFVVTPVRADNSSVQLSAHIG